MAASIPPGYDSDEEVFWGPVTAKELELLWRKGFSFQEENERCERKIDGPDASVENGPGNLGDLCHVVNSSDKLQEVPCLGISDENKAEVTNQVNELNLNLEHNYSKKSADEPLMSSVLDIPKEQSIVCDVSIEESSSSYFTNPESIQLEELHVSENFNESSDADEDKTEQLNSSLALVQNEELLPGEEKNEGYNICNNSNIDTECKMECEVVLDSHIVSDVNLNVSATTIVQENSNFPNQQDVDVTENSTDTDAGGLTKYSQPMISASVESEDSDEKAFATPDEDNDGSISHFDIVNITEETPLPLQASCSITDKENKKPSEVTSDKKSKIPVAGSTNDTLIHPAKLKHIQSNNDAKWASDLKKKKIPKPKKPCYVVSPAKFDYLKSTTPKMMNTPKKPQSAKEVNPKPTSSCPLMQQNKLVNPKIPNLSTPLATKKRSYDHIKSPVSEYIKTGIRITPSKSMPALRMNKIPVPIKPSFTSAQQLTPKYYSSAEKLIIKPGCNSQPPTQDEKQGKGFVTPKIFRHQGRIADNKGAGEIKVVTPRTVRIHPCETSYATLLPTAQKQLNVSVLEEH